MKVYLKNRHGEIDAVGVFDPETHGMIVLKGAKVSAEMKKFRGASKVIQLRKDFVKDGVLTEDISFKSASAAGNFVNGYNTNGLVAWKTEDGLILRAYLQNR